MRWARAQKTDDEVDVERLMMDFKRRSDVSKNGRLARSEMV